MTRASLFHLMATFENMGYGDPEVRPGGLNLSIAALLC